MDITVIDTRQIGQLRNIPSGVIDKMLYYQEKQTGKKDVSIFQKAKSSDNTDGGFNWSSTYEGHVFWRKVINDERHDLFHAKFPFANQVGKRYDNFRLLPIELITLIQSNMIKSTGSKSPAHIGQLGMTDITKLFLWSDTKEGTFFWSRLCNGTLEVFEEKYPNQIQLEYAENNILSKLHFPYLKSLPDSVVWYLNKRFSSAINTEFKSYKGLLDNDYKISLTQPGDFGIQYTDKYTFQLVYYNGRGSNIHTITLSERTQQLLCGTRILDENDIENCGMTCNEKGIMIPMKQGEVKKRELTPKQETESHTLRDAIFGQGKPFIVSQLEAMSVDLSQVGVDTRRVPEFENMGLLSSKRKSSL